MKTQRETPDFVCQKLLGKLPITDGIKILEPSAGEGKIIQYLLENYSIKNCDIILHELNKERISKAQQILDSLNKSHDIFYYQQDFLKTREELGSSFPYDVIVACPPFKNNVDIEHIKLMYDLLRNKGMMATLTSPYWVTNNEPHQIEFRKWLEGKDYQLELLPDDTFIEKGKTVPSAILTIYKRPKNITI